MEFRILGPIAAVDATGPRPLGGSQQRRLLAVMLSDPARVLSIERIVDVLWPDGAPPSNAHRTAISYVSRLRASLGDGWITSAGSGYALDLSGATVDAQRFEELTAAARQFDPCRAVEVWDEALALWRGAVFGELTDEWWALPTVRRLEELRLDALAARLDAVVAEGWDARGLAEAQALVSSHPLRAAFVARLMRGLDACGRTDEALRAFQAHRADLVDRTGLDPSPELVALERDLLESGHLASAAPPASSRLRGYRLLDVIGCGSFGTVHRAVQPIVDREVAIKVLNAELADDSTFIRRFDAEAQMLARLEHPHIVPLYDYWREPGGAYLVLRLVRGGTAEERLANSGRFTLQSATRTITEIGGALGAAHAAGVVHGDVKPANILFDDDGRSYLTDFGIATLVNEVGSSADATATWSSGSPLYSSPEQSSHATIDARADQYSLALTMWELVAGEPPFAGTQANEVLATKLRAPLPPLSLAVPDVPPALDDVLARAAAVRPAERFTSVTAFVDAVVAAVAGTGETSRPGTSNDGADRRAGVTATARATPSANPFKGLRPFAEADADDFFGRTDLVGALAEEVQTQPFTIVVGPSGCGKSSLVLAGLVPAMRAAGRLVVTMTPGDRPWAALATALGQVSALEHAALVTREALSADDGLPRALLALSEKSRLVLVIDQLEELWTLTDETERAAFAAALAEVAHRCDAVRTVTTIRADWFDRPLGDPELGALVARSTFGVTPLGADELTEAIVGPLDRSGVRLEAGLTARIVADAVDQPGSLPLLQFALAELFDGRHGAAITAADYETMGGLAGSVAHQAEAVYAGLSDDETAGLRRLVSRLVTIGDAGEETRRRARLSELANVPRSLIDELVDRRLLTVDRDRDTREPTVEIAHESLLRSWPRLRDWLDEDQDWLRELRELSSATRLWTTSDHDDADLYRGARLAVAEEMSAGRSDTFTPDEAEFLRASACLRDAEATAVRERARATERQNRRLRRRLTGLAAVLVVALIAGGVAVVQSRRADRQADRADQQAALADTRSEEADDQRATAEGAAEAAASAQAESERSAASARAAQLDTSFENLVTESVLVRSTQQDLAGLLAVEAFRLRPEDARSALFSTFTRNEGFTGYHPVDNTPAVYALAPFGADGHLVALVVPSRLVELDSEARVLRTFGTSPVVAPARGDLGNLVRVSADGSTAVAAMSTSDLMVWQAWSLTSGRALGPPVSVQFDQPDGGPSSLDATSFRGFEDASLNSDGTLLAISGGPRGHVLVMRTGDGSLVGELFVDPPAGGWERWPITGHTAAVAFGPDDRLLAGGPTGTVLVTEALSAQRDGVTVEQRISGEPQSVEWRMIVIDTATGPALVTIGSSWMARIDLASAATVWAWRRHSLNPSLLDGKPFEGLNPCHDIGVGTRTGTVFCATNFGSILAVDLADGELQPRTYDRQSGVTGSIAVTSDGRRLLAASFVDDALAVWNLDGTGPIQGVVAADTGSVLVDDYDVSGTWIASWTAGPPPVHLLHNLTDGSHTAVAAPLQFLGWSDQPGRYWAFDDTSVTVHLLDAASGETDMAVPVQAGHGSFTWYADAAHHRAFLVWPDLAVQLDTSTGAVGATVHADQQAGMSINSVASNADGTRLVVASENGTRLYDPATGTPIPGTATTNVLEITVSSNGIGAGTEGSGRLVLFDPDTLTKTGDLADAHGYPLKTSFSADGRLLVVSGMSDGIRVFDVASRQQLGDAIPLDADTYGWTFALRPDGRALAVPGGADGIVVWNLDESAWSDAACVIAGRNLTRDEWDAYLADFGPHRITCNDGRADTP